MIVPLDLIEGGTSLAAALAPPDDEPPLVLVPVDDPEDVDVALPVALAALVELAPPAAPVVALPLLLLLLPHPATATAHITGTAADIHLVQLRIALLRIVSPKGPGRIGNIAQMPKRR